MRGVTSDYETDINGLSIFQLTRLMRGVTGYRGAATAGSYDFNSHASCEA